jgi:hypothetical protein
MSYYKYKEVSHAQKAEQKTTTQLQLQQKMLKLGNKEKGLADAANT